MCDPGGITLLDSPTTRDHDHRIKGSHVVSLDSRADLENLISTWQGILRRREPERDMLAPITLIHLSPRPIPVDVQPHQRGGTVKCDSSIRSAGGYKIPRSFSETPSRYEAARGEVGLLLDL